MSKRFTMRDVMKALSLVTQLSITVVVAIVGSILLGKFLDSKFNTGSIFTIIFIILGIGAGFSSAYRTLESFIKEK
ncbi:MAG: AtpZ/AtpI family protein [Clostridioides sp.]|jgi:F0F1-type ATP synthase assembly protein I|nr:AtpZ/AtpI family protein [Clostridioides sp.]